MHAALKLASELPCAKRLAFLETFQDRRLKARVGLTVRQAFGVSGP